MADDPRSSLVTGATGMLGSHIAEQLVRGGSRVRALVRATSDTRFLRGIGVECVAGDLTSPGSCREALDGVAWVYHAAAKVGDWGRWPEFEQNCMVATRVLGQAAREAGVERFVHISSTSAYGHPTEGGPPVTEHDELGQNLWPVWDYYTRSKVDCERIVWDLSAQGLPLTVIRPSWLYGERDRTTTRRLVRRLRSGVVRLMGKGDNRLSAIYAGCVAEAAIQAAVLPVARNRAYNITDQGPITQREFFNLWAELAGAPAIRRRLSYPLVFHASLGLEAIARLRRSSTPPLITRYATWLMGRHVSYSTERARGELGWSPSIGYREAIGRTLAWLEAAEAGS